jgi:hypothetical protein
LDDLDFRRANTKATQKPHKSALLRSIQQVLNSLNQDIDSIAADVVLQAIGFGVAHEAFDCSTIGVYACLQPCQPLSVIGVNSRPFGKEVVKRLVQAVEILFSSRLCCLQSIKLHLGCRLLPCCLLKQVSNLLHLCLKLGDSCFQATVGQQTND